MGHCQAGASRGFITRPCLEAGIIEYCCRCIVPHTRRIGKLYKSWLNAWITVSILYKSSRIDIAGLVEDQYHQSCEAIIDPLHVRLYPRSVNSVDVRTSVVDLIVNEHVRIFGIVVRRIRDKFLN